MLSQQMIAILNKRCQETKGNFELPFGGMTFIKTGDPGQLLPVGAAPLYEYPPKSPEGLAIYKSFKYAIKLTVCVRQQIDNNPDQQKFIQLLPRIRSGVNDEKTIDDWKLLLKNEYSVLRAESFKNAIRLYCDNRSCDKYNGEKLVSLGKLKIIR
jgi:hypothetical protein